MQLGLGDCELIVTHAAIASSRHFYSRGPTGRPTASMDWSTHVVGELVVV